MLTERARCKPVENGRCRRGHQLRAPSRRVLVISIDDRCHLDGLRHLRSRESSPRVSATPTVNDEWCRNARCSHAGSGLRLLPPRRHDWEPRRLRAEPRKRRCSSRPALLWSEKESRQQRRQGETRLHLVGTFQRPDPASPSGTESRVACNRRPARINASTWNPPGFRHSKEEQDAQAPPDRAHRVHFCCCIHVHRRRWRQQYQHSVPVRATSHLSKGESGSSAVPTTNLRWLAAMVRERAQSPRRSSRPRSRDERYLPFWQGLAGDRVAIHDSGRPPKSPAPVGLARVAAIQRHVPAAARAQPLRRHRRLRQLRQRRRLKPLRQHRRSSGTSRSGGTGRTSSTSSTGSNGSTEAARGDQGTQITRDHKIDKSREGGPDRKSHPPRRLRQPPVEATPAVLGWS